MCNLYSMTRVPEAVRRLFLVQHNRAVAFEPKNAIFPGYDAPIVRNAAEGERELVNATWGFVLLQNGKAPRRVTNVRDDKVLTSSFWKQSFEQRRCLVRAPNLPDIRPSEAACANRESWRLLTFSPATHLQGNKRRQTR